MEGFEICIRVFRNRYFSISPEKKKIESELEKFRFGASRWGVGGLGESGGGGVGAGEAVWGCFSPPVVNSTEGFEFCVNK